VKLLQSDMYRNVTYWYLALGFHASCCGCKREYLTMLLHLVCILISCLTAAKIVPIAMYREEIGVYAKNHMKSIHEH